MLTTGMIFSREEKPIADSGSPSNPTHNPSPPCWININYFRELDPRFAQRNIQAELVSQIHRSQEVALILDYYSEVQEIVEMAKAVKRRSDQNKVWVYVAVGWLGHEVARSKGNCVPLRDQINKQLELVNTRHASLGVRWLYEKETLIVSFQ